MASVQATDLPALLASVAGSTLALSYAMSRLGRQFGRWADYFVEDRGPYLEQKYEAIVGFLSIPLLLFVAAMWADGATRTVLVAVAVLTFVAIGLMPLAGRCDAARRSKAQRKRADLVRAGKMANLSKSRGPVPRG